MATHRHPLRQARRQLPRLHQACKHHAMAEMTKLSLQPSLNHLHPFALSLSKGLPSCFIKGKERASTSSARTVGTHLTNQRSSRGPASAALAAQSDAEHRLAVLPAERRDIEVALVVGLAAALGRGPGVEGDEASARGFEDAGMAGTA